MKEVVPSKKQQPYKKNAKEETSSKKIKVEKPKPISGIKRKAVTAKKNEPKKFKQDVQIVPFGKRNREKVNVPATKKSRRDVDVDDSDAEFEDAPPFRQEYTPPPPVPPVQDVEFDDVFEDAQSDDAQSDQSDDANEEEAESKMSSKSSLQGLSKSQLTGLAPYGAILDKLSPEQIDQLIASGNGLTLDGRGLLKTRPSPLIVNRKKRQRSMRGNDGQIIYF
jgi:hypothetical protein